MSGRVLSVVVVGLLAQTVAYGQELSASFVQSAYDRVTPAVCVVKYASEITNPNTGRTSRRNTRALGLLVSPTGLVMAHGHMQVEDSDPFSIRVSVGMGDSEIEYDARLLHKPEDVNVCFVQIETDKSVTFPFVRFTDRELGLGEPLILVGLLGDSLDFSRSVVVRRIGAIIEKPRLTYCIDERLLFGYVGAPAINARGEVVGVVGFDLSTSEGGDLYVPAAIRSSINPRYSSL
jgi:S1-C subfamily serine protease